MTARLDEARLRRLTHAGPWLLAELDLTTLLDRFLETAREVTGARFAALGVLDEQRRELEQFLTRGMSAEQEREIGARPRGHGVLGLLITDPQPRRIRELSRDPASYGFPAGHPPMSSFLGVPIIIAEAAWGNLYLTNKDRGDFDESDEEAVLILAAWAGIAIEHARLLRDAQTRQADLERAVRGLEATRMIAVAVGAETDLARVLELIVKRGLAIAGADSAVILLQDGEDLIVAASAGHVTAGAGARIPIAGSTSGDVMKSQRPIVLADAHQLRVAPERLGVPVADSALILPLVYRGRALGTFAAFIGVGRHGFDRGDGQVLDAFAASAATAVAMAQSVQADRLRHTLAAAEAERRHWARELHDETLQGLGGLKILASSASREVDLDAIRAALGQVAEGLESEIEGLHAIITELRPAALDDLGLKPAIEALVQRHREVDGVEMDCRLDLPDPASGDHRLSPEIETTLYRMTQELLTNVAKHARAKHITLAIQRHDDVVHLRVVDDGRGFELSRQTEGFGLTGMHERAGLVGGSLAITSSAAGTTAEAEFPAHYVM